VFTVAGMIGLMGASQASPFASTRCPAAVGQASGGVRPAPVAAGGSLAKADLTLTLPRHHQHYLIANPARRGR
jgi:hypothetical protein